jgi:hypothetical protein
MSTSIQRRRGTTAQHSSFTGANGEITIDTDKEVVVVHDGATAGGYPAMRENGSNSALALGSAATPSLKFTGDPNTGIYSPGADQVAISTNGTGRLFVDATGNVGIATANPNGALDVRGNVSIGAHDTNPASIELGNGATGNRRAFIDFTGDTTYTDYGLRIERGDSGANAASTLYHRGTGDFAFNAVESSPFVFTHFLTERMRLDSTGRLGLGVSAPSSVLHTRQDVTSGDYKARSILQNTDQKTIISSYWRSGVGQRSEIQSTNDAENVPGVLVLNPAGGNVGIGTTSPGTLLHLSSATGSATPTPTELRIGTTSGGSDWSTTDPWGRISFYNADSSGGGPKNHIVFDAVSYGTVGSASYLSLKLDNGSGTLAERVQVDYLGTTTLTSAAATAPFIAKISTGEVARIDSSGRLLVGTSTSAGDGSPLQVRSNGAAPIELFRSSDDSTPGLIIVNKSRGTTASPTVVTDGDRLGGFLFKGYSGAAGSYVEGARIQAFVDGEPDTSGDTTDMPTRLVFSTTADGSSSPTERMRITSTGEALLYGTGENSIFLSSSRAAGTADNLISGRHSATGVGTGTASFIVRTNGNVINTNNSYGAISDAKLKENIVDANSQWDDLKALQVRNYNFKEGQTHTQIGLVAQEAELVSPGLVTESPDRDDEGNDLGTVTKSVNYSVLYMKAVKALQEAMERIEALEAKVAALEAS